MPVMVRLLLACALAGGAGSAAAFERSDGAQVRCEVERDGEWRAVQEVWLGHGESGDRHPALGGAAAAVRLGPDGWPVIYFDVVTMRTFRQSDPYMLDFIFDHECAHATGPERDELEANCEAFLELERQGLMDEPLERAIAATHRKWQRLPSRYGGSGITFWEKTLACVEARRGLPKTESAADRH